MSYRYLKSNTFAISFHYSFLEIMGFKLNAGNQNSHIRKDAKIRVIIKWKASPNI